MIKTGHPLVHPNSNMRPIISLPTAAHIHMNARAAGVTASKIMQGLTRLPEQLKRRVNA